MTQCRESTGFRLFVVAIALFGLAVLGFSKAEAAPTVEVTFPQMDEYYSGISQAEGTASGDAGVAVRSVYCMIHYYSVGDYTYRYWNWTRRAWQIGSAGDTVKKADFDPATGFWRCSGGFPSDWEPSRSLPGTVEPSRTYALDALAFQTDLPTNILAAGISYFYIDNVAPTIVAPADVTVEQLGPAGTPADQVNLGMPTATDPCDPDPLVTNDAPAVFSPGRTIVTWTATDMAGNVATAAQTVNVVDSVPPTISLTVLKPTLHPAHGKMVLAALVSVADTCDAAPGVAINVSSSEVIGGGKGGKGGHDKPDWQIVQDGDLWRIWLRAETASKRATRVYTIAVQATDAADNAATASDTVTVIP